MFHFGKKKASVPELVLSAENIELYRGPLSDIPLSEKNNSCDLHGPLQRPSALLYSSWCRPSISSRKADRYDHKWHA